VQLMCISSFQLTQLSLAIILSPLANIGGHAIAYTLVQENPEGGPANNFIVQSLTFIVSTNINCNTTRISP